MLGYLDTLIGFAVVMLVISLLITILTQVVSALINHRGSNLKWGLKTLLANIDSTKLPNLAAKADIVAQAVLTHCLVSDSWFSGNKVAQKLGKIPPIGALFRRFQLATAIRPAEFTAILQHLSNNTFADDQKLAADIRKLLGVGDLSAIPAVAAARERAAAIAIDDAKALENQAKQAAEAADRLQAWFGSMMDRVSQKFAMYMRIWTVAFACCFAFGLGLNTLTLITDLYSNSALRNSLAAAADQVMTSATQVLDAKNSLAARYVAAMQQALKDAKVDPLPQIPANLATPDDFTQWVQQNVPAAQQADVSSRFNALAVAASREAIQNSYAQANTLATLVANPASTYWIFNGAGTGRGHGAGLSECLRAAQSGSTILV
jgi:hypothetical protein